MLVHSSHVMARKLSRRVSRRKMDLDDEDPNTEKLEEPALLSSITDETETLDSRLQHQNKTLIAEKVVRSPEHRTSTSYGSFYLRLGTIRKANPVRPLFVLLQFLVLEA